MLKLKNDVSLEIRDICSLGLLLLEEHPSQMGVEEPTSGVVGVVLCVSESMMNAMIGAPPLGRTFKSSSTKCSKEQTNRKRSREGSVGPHAMISTSNGESREEVHNQRPNESGQENGSGEQSNLLLRVCIIERSDRND